MTQRLPRILLAASSAILAFGGVIHTAAFNKTVSTVASSNLPIFYGNALKALWLIDSATLIGLAIVFAFIAARPATASGSVIMLLALIPAATAVSLYTFIGMFPPSHMLLAAAVLTFLAGVLRTASRS